MNKCVAILLGVLVAAPVAAAPLEMSDPNYDQLHDLVQSMDGAWYRDKKTNAWLVADNAGDENGARCTAALAALKKAGVPGTRKVPLHDDTPELVRGDYALDDLRPVCANLDRLTRIKAWEKWAFQAARETGKIGGGAYYDTVFFERCVEAYGDLIKSGIPKTAKVQDRELEGPNDMKITWAGTVEQMRKKWCDVGLKKVQAEIAAKQAPYRKLLKNDKLAMALETGAFHVAGGAVTGDAKRLAAANVWFSDTQSVNDARATCRGGSDVHTVHRYEFDGTHKLVKTTDKQYCGKVPKSAYK